MDISKEKYNNWLSKIIVPMSNRDLYTYFKNNPKTSYRKFFNDSEKESLEFVRLKSYKSKIDLLTF